MNDTSPSVAHPIASQVASGLARFGWVLLCLLLATSCASTTGPQDTETLAEDGYAENGSSEEENPDPWERMNRKLFNMNDNLDRRILKPIAKGYKKVMPKPMARAVGNVFGNMDDVGDAVNNLLQGKVKESISDVARVLINSTIGLGGLFDPASRMGLEDHDESFGQTLAKWGVPSGPYIVLPLVGPTTLRDMMGSPVDFELDPLRLLSPADHRKIVGALSTIHGRSELLAVESVIFGDKYIFIRDAYLQRGAFLSSDGEVEDLFDDEFGDDFGDEFDDDYDEDLEDDPPAESGNEP